MAAMDVERCWELIESARAAVPEDTPWDDLCDAMEEAMVDRLAALSAAEVIAYELRFGALQGAMSSDATYVAAFLIRNGCGDDAFSDFCAGMVGLGRDWYHRVLADPDSLADHPAVHGILAGTVAVEVFGMEGFQYAASQAYERIAGEEDAFSCAYADDLAAEIAAAPAPRASSRLPRLSALFPEPRAFLERFQPHLFDER
ncbi:DUF4240 domain-containing protein [Dactylosporangium salmoneum]